jgi:predicted glycogen debranching enzyme
VQLSGGEFVDGRVDGEGFRFLKEFRLDWQIPTWTYEIDGTVVQKRITMPYNQSTVYVEYRILSGNAVTLHLRPYVTFRGHDERLGHPPDWPFTLSMTQGRFEMRAHENAPVLRMGVRPKRGVFVTEEKNLTDVYYSIERERGLDDNESLHSPGYFQFELSSDDPAAFVASVEPWSCLEFDPGIIFEAEHTRLRNLLARAPEAARQGWARHLVLAADQFIILPGNRVEENALLQASGDRVRTVIAGYHWFTDWGRDTMISLEGLTICTGRLQEARAILRTFSHYVKDGLLPNHFPEGQRSALYHTVDASFWYFHAIDRYLEASGDKDTLQFLYPTLVSMIDHHIKGTHYGIGMDDHDALIREGFREYPLTWMDAKVDDFIVTPRRGKPVEIQSLWYNALRLMTEWSRQLGQASEPYETLAANAYESFNRRFWYGPGGYLYDLVDGEKGDDPTLRPNQIFSFALRYPVLAEERWKSVLETVGHRLWARLGLRTLDPRDPEYKPVYRGTRRARDAAYHQGLVWAWLIGPYVNAYVRVHPDPSHVERLMKGFEAHLRDAGVGTISEIFDADDPHSPRGCVAQAWSVAEALRVLVLAGSHKTSHSQEKVLSQAR